MYMYPCWKNLYYNVVFTVNLCHAWPCNFEIWSKSSNYMAVLKFGCEIQNFGGNVSSFSRIQCKYNVAVKYHFSYFCLKIWELSGFQVYGEIILQIIREFQRDFPRKLQHSIRILEVTKRILNVHFSFATSGHAWRRLTVNLPQFCHHMHAQYTACESLASLRVARHSVDAHFFF